METYLEMKVRHQAEVDALPFGFAFSDEQFKEIMQNWGLPCNKEGYKQIVSFGAGSFLRKEDVPQVKEVFARQKKERQEARRNLKIMFDAFYFEFKNHESQIIKDDEMVCEAVGLSWAEVQNNPDLLKTYNRAWKKFWQDCLDNDWF